MIQPVNNHLLIKPVAHETFVATERDTYEEIGEVLAVPHEWVGIGTSTMERPVNVGDRVYFDSWLAAKFPGETEGEHYWLIKWEHVRAIENAEG